MLAVYWHMRGYQYQFSFTSWQAEFEWLTAQLTKLCRSTLMTVFFLLQGPSNSYAIKKKDELEQVAKSNH